MRISVLDTKNSVNYNSNSFLYCLTEPYFKLHHGNVYGLETGLGMLFVGCFIFSVYFMNILCNFTCTKLYLILKLNHIVSLYRVVSLIMDAQRSKIKLWLEYIYMPMFDGDAYDKKKGLDFFSCITITGIFWIWCTNKYIQTKDLNSSTLVSSMQCLMVFGTLL